VATFTVNSTADIDDSNLMDGVCADATGACTLRAAMQQANFSVGADTINFSIGSGVKTINVGSTGLGPLPTLSEAVTIDGTTQPGFAGTPLIELNGSLAGAGVSGLKAIGGGNSVVRGLAIYFFNGHGIWLAPRNGGETIEGNFIGTNAAGNAALGNSLDGVHISNASSNTIGGTQVPPDPGTPPGNLISGNHSDGVEINGAGAPGNRVQGNLIGTNAAGAAALGNSLDGVRIIGGDSNTIGGAVVGAGNIISGNGAHGVEISGSSLFGHRVQNNNIGTNAADTAALGNNGDGVFINGTPNNTIGGGGDPGDQRHLGQQRAWHRDLRQRRDREPSARQLYRH